MKLSQLRRFIREIVIREASKPTWYITVSYPSNTYSTDMDNKIHKVARAFGVQESGSGSDGRYRDIGFVTKDEEKAKKFAAAVKKIPKVKASIEMQTW